MSWSTCKLCNTHFKKDCIFYTAPKLPPLCVVNQNDTVFQFIISQSILSFCFKVTPHAEVLHHGVWKRKTAVWGDVFVSPGILLNTCVRLDYQTGVHLARPPSPLKRLWKHNDVINRTLCGLVPDSVIFSGLDTAFPRTKFVSPYRRQFTNKKKSYSMKCIIWITTTGMHHKN